MIFEHLQQFRQEIYDSLGYAKDAVFELMDAVLTSSSIPSFVSLSQSPVFRRQWPSVYAALQDSRLSPAKVSKRIVKEVDTSSPVIISGDSTLWERPDAVTLRERTFGYDGRSSVLAQSYSTLVWVPEASGSWALPLRHDRISSFETAVSKAAFQLRQVTQQLSVRPLAIFDRAYGNATFVNQTSAIESDLLLRIASNRCLWGAPPPYKGRGAPRKHGVKFKLSDPTTWPEVTQSLEIEHPEYGRVLLMHWREFHFRGSAQCPMDIIRVEVLQAAGVKRKFKVLWLAWLGQTMPELSTLALTYLRRFAIEHWYRFIKQRLYWTHPQLSSTQASERWSLLVMLMSWQLWWARNECVDAPLPWQAPQDNLSAGRVAQAFASILVAIGTPAKAPKVRGKAPGRAKGERPATRRHYPTVKKRHSKPKSSEETPLESETSAA